MFGFFKFSIILILGTALTSCSPPDQDPETVEVPEFRSLGVKLRVSDMEIAEEFYTGVLGFSVVSEKSSENLVKLEANPAVYLEKVGNTSEPGGPVSEQALVLQTNDIMERVSELEEKGVEFIYPEPGVVGVGIATAFKDPFGITVRILEQTTPGTVPVEEPAVYNYGYRYLDVDKARDLYVNILGFVVRTESYYPPALPLGHSDGTFGFMVFLAEAEPKISQYPDGTGTTILFSTNDLDLAFEYLKENKINVKMQTSDQIPGGRRIIMEDHRGGFSEIWESN